MGVSVDLIYKHAESSRGDNMKRPCVCETKFEEDLRDEVLDQCKVFSEPLDFIAREMGHRSESDRTINVILYDNFPS